MADTSLIFNIVARDHATKTFDHVKRRAALIGAAVGALGAKFAVDSVRSLARIEQINAQTEQAIKSTGGAAGASAKHIENLAGRLEKLTATEAESTQEGANLLLTFTDIQNKAGKGNAIFDRATKTIVDMSRALGQDTKSSALQLGKALNDPIKGVTALQRVGVSFTKDQKDQIKTLVESGDKMGAQKVILGELSKEFGGSGKAFAKTTTGQIELAKHSFGTLGETMAAKLLPAAEKLAKILLSTSDFIERNHKVVVPLAAALGTLVGIVWGINKAAKAYAATQAALNIVLTANPVGLVIAAIALLVVGMIVAYKKSEKFREFIDRAFSGVAAAGQAMWEALKAAFGWIVDKFLWVAGAIVNAAAKAFGWVPGIGPKLKKAAREFDQFRDSVNASLSGIQKTIPISFVAIGTSAPTSRYAGKQLPIDGKVSTSSDSQNLKDIRDSVVRRNRPDPLAAGFGAM